MTLAPRVGGPGVSLRQPQIVRQITYFAVLAGTIDHTTIEVPHGLLRTATVFMPPGTNYSVWMQLGFNGQRQIPTQSVDDYIVGSGIEHKFPWSIEVQGEIDVWAWHWNANPHTVYVKLDIDVQSAIDWAQPYRPNGISTLRAVV